MNWYILAIALAGFDAYTVLSVYNRMLPRRSSRRWIVVAAVVCVAYKIVTQPLNMNETVTAIISAGLCVALSFPFWAKWRQRLFYSILLIALEIAAEIIAGYTISMATGIAIPEIANQARTLGTTYLIGATLAKLIFFLLARSACRLQDMRDRSIKHSHWLIVMLIPVTSIIIQYGLAIASTQYSLTNYTAPFLILLGMLAINTLAFSVYDVMSSQAATLVDLERAKSRMSYEIQNYETILEHSKRISAQAHDIRSHMVALQGLLSEKRVKEAERYILEIAMPEYIMKPALVPSYPAINALLGDKIAAAESRGISIAHKISLLNSMPGRESDLCIILSNALDNAIDACGVLADNKAKEITLDMSSDDSKLMIRIVNTSPPVEIEDGTCRTTKMDKSLHGFGLNNIRHVVEGLGGNMVIQYEGGLFTLIIVLFK